jgi:peptide/nickel transport system permease protein
MTTFIIRRLIYAVFVVAGVCIAVFFVTQALGDPARMMLPLEATDEQVEAFRHLKGWDRPIYIQFWDFMKNAIRLDFGESIWLHEDAFDLVLARFPRTVQLVLLSMFLSVVISIPLGILAGLKPQSTLDRMITTVGFAGVSIPDYFLAIILIIIFSMNLHWVKSSGYDGFNPQYYILPAMALAARPIGRIMLITRSSIMDALNKQYIVTARAKGIHESMVVIRHALKNALIPIITLGGWQMTRLLAGLTIAVEVVSAWPGVGLLAFNAIEHRDLPLLQANVFFVALVVTLLNLLIDISYAMVDPRIHYS